MNYKESIEDLENAITKLQKSSTQKPKQAEVHNQLGLSYVEDAKFEKALDQYNKAIDIQANNNVYYNNRSLAHSHLKAADLALADLNKALSIESRDPKTYFNRGAIYVSLAGKDAASKFPADQARAVEDYGRAHEDYDKAIELAEKIPAYKNKCIFHHAKGLAYFFAREYELAKEWFKLAIQRDPGYMPSLFHYGLMQHQLKDQKGALASLTAVIETNKENKSVQDRIVTQNNPGIREQRTCLYGYEELYSCSCGL